VSHFNFIGAYDLSSALYVVNLVLFEERLNTRGKLVHNALLGFHHLCNINTDIIDYNCGKRRNQIILDQTLLLTDDVKHTQNTVLREEALSLFV